MADPRDARGSAPACRSPSIDPNAIDDGFFSALCMAKGIDASTIMDQYEQRGPERLLDLQIRTGPFGDGYGAAPDGLTLQSFKERPHGIDMGPLVPRLDEVLATPSGKIELAPSYITATFPGWPRASRRGRPELVWCRDGISARTTRGSQRRAAGPRPRPLHAADPSGGRRPHRRVGRRAGARDVGRGRRRRRGAGERRDAPGVVSLPHGWGHDKPGTRMKVAHAHAGVNSNVLAPGTLTDPVSNNAVVNGIPVRVAPAG
jgi:hypothetical protein